MATSSLPMMICGAFLVVLVLAPRIATAQSNGAAPTGALQNGTMPVIYGSSNASYRHDNLTAVPRGTAKKNTTLTNKGLATTHNPRSGVAFRRSLLRDQRVVCSYRPNMTYSGGKLPNGPKRLTKIGSAAACCVKCSEIKGCARWSYNTVKKYCYPKAATGWTKSMRANFVSGRVKTYTAPEAKAVRPPADKLYWRPKLTIGDHQLRRDFATNIQVVKASNNRVVIADPFTNTSDVVIKTTYPKGCWSPRSNCNGGALFYAWPEGTSTDMGNAVRLEYEVYFPENFDWVKGGKLPGLAGGRGCSGGANPTDCFSVRLMWRSGGEGEAYIYANREAQMSNICEYEGTHCNEAAGMSFMRGAFSFKKGVWQKMAITIRLNDVGRKDGVIQVDQDGDRKISYDKLVWRTSDLKINAFLFSTWFGGGDSSWAPTYKNEAYWKNFKIYQIV